MDARPSDVLVIEHEAGCPPGVLADVLAEAGLTLHLHRLYRGDQLPMDLGTFEGPRGPHRPLRRRAPWRAAGPC